LDESDFENLIVLGEFQPSSKAISLLRREILIDGVRDITPTRIDSSILDRVYPALWRHRVSALHELAITLTMDNILWH
jgi:hypothetical protein